MKSAVKTFVMESGERYCLLIDKNNGLPLFYPNLFLTTQVRNRSLSYSSMESALSGISVLMRFMKERNEIIEDRFRSGDFFNINELDAIRDFCQIRFKSSLTESDNGMFTLFELREYDDKVSAQTEYVRLTIIAQYTKWLAEQFNNNNRLTKLQITEMEKGLKTRRPVRKNRNLEFIDKGLDKEQINLLFEVLRPASELNPFIDESVRVRNRLIFMVLFHLGVRGGELLNIRIRDFDFGVNQLVIARRADDVDDPRTKQPLVKTLDRRLPMKDTLANEIHRYILNDRKKIPNSNKNDFLFVTHKSGRTQGLPLSISGYKKVIQTVSNTSKLLYDLKGHALRHSWNHDFSECMDEMDEPPSHEEQEKMRSYLMGWKEGSGTSATYNKRFIQAKANKAALELQEGMIRLPRGMGNGK